MFAYDVSVNDLDADSWDANFASIGASVVVTSDQGAEQYNTAVENAVNAVFSDTTKRGTFLGCTPSGQAGDTCVRGYVQKLGLRAWRRPLERAELDRFVSLAASASTTLGSAVEGARWATVALFESPNFIYRPELGAPAANGALRLSGYEMAGRLSFLIWNSLPDQMLMDQASSGMLGTADGIRTAVTRMLTATAGRESVGAFAEEYMRLDRILTQAKDPAGFPEYTPTLQAAMVRDMRDTWSSLAFDDQASALDLFTTPKVVVNSELAKLYGLDTTGLTATTFQTKSLPAHRAPRRDPEQGGLLVSVREPAVGLADPARQVHARSADVSDRPATAAGRQHRASVDAPTDVPMTKRQKLEMHRASLVVRRLSRADGPHRVAARELRRRSESTGRRTTACRSIRPARSTGSRWPMLALSASRPARAPPSRNAWCASTTATPWVTKSATPTEACSTRWRPPSRPPASSCGTSSWPS